MSVIFTLLKPVFYIHMQIYTKTGDGGETSLIGGVRVKKNCLEMEAIGEVDELNAAVGVLAGFLDKVEDKKNDWTSAKNQLMSIQNNLFVVGANLAGTQTDLNRVPKLKEVVVADLEAEIDKMETDLPKLTQFILPGGSEAAAQGFYTRAICRRAERRVVEMGERHPLDPNIKKYLNRLSDYLFVLGRWINRREGIGESVWEK